MLTREEARSTLNFFKIFSCVLPIKIDMKSGKIQRQFSRVKVWVWRILYGVAVSHWLYNFGRLVQSTVIDREKYFRWDHFIMHFGVTSCFAVFHFTGFCLFVKTPDENVMIFNQLFKEREDSVQKMIDEELQIQLESENENKVCVISSSGNQTRVKSGPQSVSASVSRPNEEGQGPDEVIEKSSESDSEVCPRPRHLLAWPLQYSLDELLAKLLPAAALFAGFFAIVVLAVDPSRSQLLYSSLPPEYQNFWSFLILLAVESLCMNIVMFTAGFGHVTQVMILDKCQLEFKRMSLQLRHLQEKFQKRSTETGSPNGGRSIEREIWILRQILKEMKELVVLIELFNRCFPFCIFSWKIFSLATSITFYFFVIRHYEAFPFLTVFAGYCAINITVIYTIMYRDAFSIPGKMDVLKQEFLLTAQKTTRVSNADVNVNKTLRAEMKREIKRIRNVGIKVGDFHHMERESTPNFVDFVLRNVVTLLVTFPK